MATFTSENMAELLELIEVPSQEVLESEHDPRTTRRAAEAKYVRERGIVYSCGKGTRGNNLKQIAMMNPATARALMMHFGIK